MLLVLHGDNTVESRQNLFERRQTAKEKGQEILVLDGRNLDLTAFIQALESQSLFSREKLVIVEDLFAENSRGPLAAAVMNHLTKNPPLVELVLWERKLLTPAVLKQLKNLPKISLKTFKHPAIIFTFLESLKPQNVTATLALLQQTLALSQPEVIFFMLVRHFRLLLALKLDANIAEIKRLMTWQSGKLKKQAALFEKDQLLKIYKELLIIDYQSKSGRLNLDLTKTLESFIMTI